MATFMKVDRVQYLTPSGVQAPVCKLYFCRHCLQLRSSGCVSHEVDSHYCPNCLENMPSAEAKLKKNRCANCFDCPSCKHILSTRATTVSIPNADDTTKVIPKKVYYLACAFCRWSSRDVGIPEQVVASGGWPEQENPHAKRIGTALDYYRQLAAREKAEKEKKRYNRRRSYIHLSDKYGLNSTGTRRRPGLLSIGTLSLKDSEDLVVKDLPMSDTVEDFDELPDDIYTSPLCLTEVTTITQRHANPEFQPDNCAQLYPRHKHLLIKRSLRCRECEHNLSKPDFNPSSIKFKIQLVALHHVPEIRIMTQPNLIYGRETQVILTLFNPLDSLTHVTLSPLEKEDKSINSKVEVPSCELVLSPRDDAAEFDDNADQQYNFNDDPKIVVFRKANKIGFFIKVVPNSKEDDIKVAFDMKYDYRNMTAALQSDNKEIEKNWLKHTIYINLGKAAAI